MSQNLNLHRSPDAAASSRTNVRKVTCCKSLVSQCTTPVAIKTSCCTINNGEDIHQKRAARELYCWAKCDHRYVVPLLGVAEFRGQIAMVSQWMENGDLRSYINKNPNIDRMDLCIQLAEALDYLHGRRIVHGDLKGSNVLISDDGFVKLADFGNAILEDPTLRFTESTGALSLTLRWAAPEMSQGSKHTIKTDVYPLGMTILEIFTGKSPYHGRTDAQFLYLLLNKEILNRPLAEIPNDDERGDALWCLLQECWQHDPILRPTASQVLGQLQKLRSRASIQQVQSILDFHALSAIRKAAQSLRFTTDKSDGYILFLYRTAMQSETLVPSILLAGVGNRTQRLNTFSCPLAFCLSSNGRPLLLRALSDFRSAIQTISSE